MTPTTMTHRRRAPLRVSRSAALAAWQRHAALLVEGTSIEDGEANRRRMVRTRRARRLLRAVSMPLLLALAVASGLAVGSMGEGTRAVRTIAPTRQPIYRQVNSASLLPLALIPATQAAK